LRVALEPEGAFAELKVVLIDHTTASAMVAREPTLPSAERELSFDAPVPGGQAGLRVCHRSWSVASRRFISAHCQ
jgi:3-hydroxyisobutyrate dehydrogenase-like beta-hydroxyacid dehydrogenase